MRCLQEFTGSGLIKVIKAVESKGCLRNHHGQEEPCQAVQYPKWDLGTEKKQHEVKVKMCGPSMDVSQ